MADAIVMPSLGMFTAEGELTAWLKAAGDGVEAGEPIAAVTTEKTTQEIAAPSSGILHPVAAVGALLPIQGLIGYILAEGEVAPAGPVTTVPPSPQNDRSAAQRETAPPVRLGSGVAMQSGEVRASPIARRLSAENGIDLRRLIGTGPGGRIVEADVQAAITQSQESQAPAASSTTPKRLVHDRIPLVGMRRTIAERLLRSITTTASVTLTREIDAEALAAARVSLGQRLGGRLTYDALFVKLFGMALRAHLALNAVIEDDAIVVLDEIHVGFAVAISQGLVVPVVRNADARPLAEVAELMAELSQRAANNTLHADDVAGGTATITNLGAHGVDAFSPILNPPQSVILGCGRVIRRPVVHADELTVRHVCTLSLTFDHRVTDGVPAARLLDQMARFMADRVQLDGLV
ncbi:MAG: 2-oxo acid dehydrogenase subunit E2 [Chloroflexota bacterium]|nr:2-oxo acid dehydrogenase subunit E2 [Chloroflexota bacterium]